MELQIPYLQVPAGKSPGGLICSNWCAPQHLLLNLVAHLALLVRYRCYCQEDPPGSYQMLQHYFCVWIAIVSSPRGLQMDCWCSVLLLMDLMPLAYALVDTLSKTRLTSPEGRAHLVRILSRWSPAFQLSNVTYSLANGHFANHVHAIMVVFVLVTKSNKWVLRNVYCEDVPPLIRS